MSTLLTDGSAQMSEVPVCRAEDVPADLGRAFDVAGRTIAIFRTRSGGVHAVDNTCPHRGGPLADGMLADGRIVCPFHASRFNLNDGRCDQQGACAIDVFPARVQDGWIIVSVSWGTE